MEAPVSLTVPEDELVLVEYPGYVQNAAEAIRTLGGSQELTTGFVNGTPFLRLKARPDDPLSHPLYGDRSGTTGLLLRIFQPAGGTASNGTASPQVSVVARVNSKYQFRGIADLQYLSVPSHARQDGSTIPEPLLLVPPLLSKVDIPLDYGFFGKSGSQVDEGLPAVSTISFHSVAVPTATQPAEAQTQPAPNTTQPFATQPAAAPSKRGRSSKTPLVAPKTASSSTQEANASTPQDVNGSGSGTQQNAAAGSAPGGPSASELQQLLQDRPVWSLLALQARVPGVKPAELILQLCEHCYQFKSGPWHGLYIRKGYDPRYDKSSRKYQAIKPHPRGAQTLASTQVAAAGSCSTAIRQPQPAQLCDIADPEVTALVASAPCPESCGESSGWFLPTGWQQISSRIRNMSQASQGIRGAVSAPTAAADGASADAAAGTDAATNAQVVATEREEHMEVDAVPSSGPSHVHDVTAAQASTTAEGGTVEALQRNGPIHSGEHQDLTHAAVPDAHAELNVVAVDRDQQRQQKAEEREGDMEELGTAADDFGGVSKQLDGMSLEAFIGGETLLDSEAAYAMMQEALAGASMVRATMDASAGDVSGMDSATEASGSEEAWDMFEGSDEERPEEVDSAWVTDQEDENIMYGFL